MTESGVWGVVAEFDSSDDLVAAARAARAAGWSKVDAYTPFPVEGLADALGLRRSRLPLVVLAGGLIGGMLGFALQYWVSCIEYPMNVGGKPDNSWPAFIPITFEMTILGAALSAVLGMLGANGLPQPHHPLFNVPAFRFASRDRFFLSIASTDPAFDLVEAATMLRRLHAVSVEEVHA